MRVFIDGTQCPVVDQAARIAAGRGLKVFLYCEEGNAIQHEQAETVVVKDGERLDFALLADLEANDLVVTQDHGMCIMILSKKAYAISPNGLPYNNGNLDSILMLRNAVSNAKSGCQTKKISTRSAAQDERFAKAFADYIEMILQGEAAHQEENHA